MRRNELSPQEVRDFLDYDEETGVFTWKDRPDFNAGMKARIVGTRAGRQKTSGYRVIRIHFIPRYEHRLAVAWMTGEWPKGEVDHLNGGRDDNRWANLRDVPKLHNAQNNKKSSSNKSGYVGVHQGRLGKWVAQISVGGKPSHLGTFESAEVAYGAYIEAKTRLHPGATFGRLD